MQKKTIANCNHVRLSSGQQKYQLGKLLKCLDCGYEMIILRCPFLDCNALMYKDKKYKMGYSVQCSKCKRFFNQIVCQCGNIINDIYNGTFCQGITRIMCTKCWKNFVLFTCQICSHQHYRKQSLRIGENVICQKCKTKNIYFMCPFCYQKVPIKQMQFGKLYKCLNDKCKLSFSFTVCPYCIEINYSSQQVANQSIQKYYNKGCNKSYIHLNCNQCLEVLYLQNTIKLTRIEQNCLKCKKKLIIYHCKCGKISVNCKTCPICFIDISSIITMKNHLKSQNLTYQQVQILQNKSVKLNQSDRRCKSCLDKQANMINISCGHVCLCNSCYQNIQKMSNLKDKCIICKTKGIYKKVYY